MELEEIKEKAKCCITEKPLSTSVHLNGIQLPYKSTWEFPRWGNFLTGQEGMAMAYVHDEALKEDGTLIGPIRFAIECTDDDIIYHPLESLIKEDIKRPSATT